MSQLVWSQGKDTVHCNKLYEQQKMEIAGKRRRSPIVIVPHRNVLEKVASHQRFINASFKNKMMFDLY